MHPQSLKHYLWVRIFSNIDLCHFSYGQLEMRKLDAIHPGTVRQATIFQCEFPFFWIIKENIDAKLDHAQRVVDQQKVISSRDRTDNNGLHRQLCQLLNDNPIASILNQIDSDDISKLLESYINDFLRSKHKVQHIVEKEEEYKV